MKHIPNLQILDYQPKHKSAFEKLNKAWIEKYFVLEPVDLQVLENPEEYILKTGGTIIVAEYEGEACGVVALKKSSDNLYEMTKMAVSEKYQGKKIGLALGEAILEKARALRIGKVELYSQTDLTAAVTMYRKLGFQEVSLREGKYTRCNIKMEIDFAKADYLAELSQKLRKTVDIFLVKTVNNGVNWNEKKEFRKWSPKETIGHLIDSATNNHQRFIVAQSVSEYVGNTYTQDFWVNTHNYHHLPAEQVLEFWRQYNYMLAQVIKNINYNKLETLCKIGDHPPVTLKFLVEDYIVHMEHHLGQIL